MVLLVYTSIYLQQIKINIDNYMGCVTDMMIINKKKSTKIAFEDQNVSSSDDSGSNDADDSDDDRSEEDVDDDISNLTTESINQPMQQLALTTTCNCSTKCKTIKCPCKAKQGKCTSACHPDSNTCENH